MINLNRFRPQSLATRTSLFLLVVILSAEFIAGFIWYQQNEKKQQQGLVSVVNSLALSAYTTISYFSDLPLEYRVLALNQLRNMGGSRFFVSLNNHQLPLQTIEPSAGKRLVLNELYKSLSAKLPEVPLFIDISKRRDLVVFDAEINFDQLPVKWRSSSLLYKELNPPIIVIQVPLSEDEWFYLAAILPEPYVLINSQFITSTQLFFMAISALVILFLTWFIVRREIKPIANLANAALQMDGKIKVSPLKEQGSQEVRTAIKAFNKMNQRIITFTLERDVLFSAISHDLQTPLACLKLRSEMLEDKRTREKFQKLLNDMAFMLKGALHCIKNTDIHEDMSPVDFVDLIHCCSEVFDRSRIQLTGQQQHLFIAKPVAIQRCLQNIINNAMKYAQQLTITIEDSEQALWITFKDDGPGIPAKLLEKVFEPYFRCDERAQLAGTGLGLTIARNIARIHRGDISLINRSGTGLTVSLILYRD
ncbi:ATP-binding protein [Psychromonas hadalis]|uniref:ATP-binding protein n=1 Tax=Psychromonas hadalis TaxID=211669 RepID=UPI0003FC693A|nr:ATP-binding protein [Psychromonas hadalis]